MPNPFYLEVEEMRSEEKRLVWAKETRIKLLINFAEAWILISGLVRKILGHPLFFLLSILAIIGDCITLMLITSKSTKFQSYQDLLQTYDTILAAYFTFELGLNFIGVGIRNYLKSGWNQLDFFIISATILSYIISLIFG